MTPHRDDPIEHRPAGPVRAGDPPPPPVAKASSGAVPPTPPPAGDAANQADQGADAGVSPTSEAADVEHDIDALLADTQRERDEYLDLAKRTKADFENYRRRMAADVQAAALRGKASVAEGMIDAVENLERALASEGIDESTELEDGFANGVRLVYLGMKQTLARFGIEDIDPRGETFDPEQHEALQKVSVEGATSETVVDVIQKGIRLDDQLVRPARVVVAE